MTAEESPVPARSISNKSIPELAFEYMGDPPRALEDLRAILRVSYEVFNFVDITDTYYSRYGVYLRDDCTEKGTWVRAGAYHVAAALKLAKEQAPEVFQAVDPATVWEFSDAVNEVTAEDTADLFPIKLFVTPRQKVEQICREFEHEIHTRQLTQMKTRLGGKSFPDELSVQLAARFIKNPTEIYDYFCHLVDDALKLLEWKDWPGTDVTFTSLSDEASEERVRAWFERNNSFFSGVKLAVSKASVELREYLTHRFIQADPEMWSMNGKKISDVKDVPEEVVWAMIQSHGIVPKRCWWGLSNMRAAMFRGLEQERGTALLLSDDVDELNDSFSDVVGFMSCLRDRLFLDDALNTELAKVGVLVVEDASNSTEPNGQGLEEQLPADGPDESECVFRWNGLVVEGFTPNGFDVLKAMWAFMDNEQHRVRRADVAAFLPDRMATWKFDVALKNFSKYQTEIFKAFESAKMSCPWKYDKRTKYYVKSHVYRRVDNR